MEKVPLAQGLHKKDDEPDIVEMPDPDAHTSPAQAAERDTEVPPTAQAAERRAQVPQAQEPRAPQVPQEPQPVRDATNALAQGRADDKKPTNSTGARGLDYWNSLDELANDEAQADRKKEDERRTKEFAPRFGPQADFTEEEGRVAPLLSRLSEQLLESRGETIHSFRVRVVLTVRCFLDVIKVLLQYDEKARALWFQKKDVRRQLVSGFASYMAAAGSMCVDIKAYDEHMQCVYWGALQYVSRTFEDAVAGWENISGTALSSAPGTLRGAWHTSNVLAIWENDELVSEKQESKLVAALLSMVTSEQDFRGEAAQQYKENSADCKQMLSFLVADQIARFPTADDKLRVDDDDGDSDEEEEDAWNFDVEENLDASYHNKDGNESRVEEGEAVLDMDEDRQGRIAAFTIVAKQVVCWFAGAVCKKFAGAVEQVPGRSRSQYGRLVERTIAPAIVLPARNASDRRKVVFVAHSELDEYLVNSRRPLGRAVSPSGFYLPDFAWVYGNLYIGNAAGAFHAGPAGFSLVVNCAAADVPDYFKEFPGREIEYVSLRLPGGPNGIAQMREQDWKTVRDAVTRHKDGKILVHCVEGRHRSAGVVFDVLKTCFNLEPNAACCSLFRVSPLMDFVDLQRNFLEPAFGECFGESLGSISFAHTTEALRISYGADCVLPVTTLTPFYSFTSGGPNCSLVDYLIEFGVRTHGFSLVADFFAAHISSALVGVRAPIYLACYPPHSPGGDKKLAPIIRRMCGMHPDRFVDGTSILERTRESPQRSKGGDRSIQVQLDTISCKLPQGSDDATFVCLDEVFVTGSSFAVFGQLMTGAGASGDMLRGIALGRYTHNPSRETQSDFVIPSTRIASDVSVATPAEVCVDVPRDFVPPVALRCQIVREEASFKTLAFPNRTVAEETARAWIAALCMNCCPHFPISGLGFPAQLVNKADHVVRVLHVSGKNLFSLSKVDGAQGSARNARVLEANKEWTALNEQTRKEWEERSAAPVTTQEARDALERIFPSEGDVVWELLDHGGGNLVRFQTKKEFNKALKEKTFGESGLRVERAFGAVLSRVWVPLSLSHEVALRRIQSLSSTRVICTLTGSSLTAKTLSKHDGGVLNLTGENFRTECPLVKWGCDATWSAAMQFCSEEFLGYTTFKVLRDVYLKHTKWQGLFGRALELYFRSLEQHCTVNCFGGRSAEEAAKRISGLLATETLTLQRNDVALLALFHFSRKDIYRCMVYKNKLRGLSTAGGTLIHIGLHIPDLPWTGRSEAQKTFLSYRELGDVSRASAPLPVAKAESRIAVLRALVAGLPIIDKDEVWMKAAKDSATTKSGAQNKLKAAKKLLEAWRQRLTVLCGIARELASFANAPAHHLAALVKDLRAAFDVCDQTLLKVAADVRFRQEVYDDSAAKGKVKKVPTTGLSDDLKKERKKVKKQLLQCRAVVDLQKLSAPGHDAKAPPVEELSATLAAKSVQSVQGQGITLVFANDSGASGDFVTAVPEPMAGHIFETCLGRNLASQGASSAKADPDADAEPFANFNLSEHTLRIELTAGLAQEARNTVAEQSKMAEYVAHKNERFTETCTSALDGNIGFGGVPLTPAGRRVAESLLELESIMSAPCKFLGSSSTMRCVGRVASILLHSVVLCGAYSAPLYRDARGRTGRAVDKVTQMHINKMELATLEYASDAVVQLMHRVYMGEDVDVQDELKNASNSVLDLKIVAKAYPKDKAKQLPYLIMKSCEVLRALQGSIVNYSKSDVHERIRVLRESWSRSGKDPPTAILCQGTWNRKAPSRGSFGSGWQRAKHQRAVTRNLIRRAKQIRWHLEKRRLGQESSVTSNFLSSVSIQSKRISEIRSTKQKLSFAALLSHERIDTQGPPQSLFPGLSKDRPWKLRWSKGDSYVVHRDHMASCALAILGMWERFAFAYNQIQELIDPSQCVLLRPAVYLYHTDYAKWTNGTLKIKNIQRW